ncbi:MAG: polysaccharide deacetylase family protein [Firmicutes bacterium]|nr:polysaccharide deacetylase family protein [Bacillota bacterium]
MIKKMFFMLGCLLFMAAGLFSYIHGVSEKELLTAAPADSRDSVEIPIIMYHSITAGQTSESEYVISAERFENDLIWLQENGFTSILPSQLADYVMYRTRLPAKPVILSFDDGYCNNYTLAYPLLQKYNMKAVIAVIGYETDISSREIYRNPANCSLSWGEIAIMAKSGLVEFANHTWSLHKADAGGRKGADKLPGEDFENYRRTLIDDIGKNQALLEKAAGKAPQVFAWPYGAYPMDGCADSVLKELGFDATFVSYQHTSSVKAGAPDSLYGLGRWLRTPSFDISVISE